MTLGRWLSYGALLFAPLFFSSNMLFGKAVIANVEPWTLAFVRWGLVSLLLLPIATPAIFRHRHRLMSLMSMAGVMAFLGMWICGAIVYFALTLTSATNAILIYLSSPVLIVLFEALYRGRRILLCEGFGILVASGGVLIILMRGDWQTILALQFNAGDLAMIFAAISWAVYSVMFKSDRLSGLPSTMLLCIFSGFGALLLLPFAAFEFAFVASLPTDLSVWGGIAGIIFTASIAAFLAYQHSVRTVGPAIAGIFMYLLPIYGVGLAVLVLGERFEDFHLAGIVTVLGGVILATFPTDLFTRMRPKRA